MLLSQSPCHRSYSLTFQRSQVGGSLAKVVYFTRSRSSSDPQSSRSPSQSQPPASPASSSSSSFSPRLETGSNSSLSRSHSRQASANGVGGHPRSPSNEALSSSISNHPTPSGTLTPTAILSERNPHRPPHIGSAVNAMRSSLLKRRSLPGALPGGRLNFIKFETSDIESCIAFLTELIESSAKANRVTIEEMRRGVKLMATGGGAHLFYERFEKALGVEVQREDEMGCLITGLNFITLIPDEVFWYSDELVSALHSPLPHAQYERGDPSIGPSTSSASLKPDEPLPRPSPNPPLYAPMFDSNPTPKLPCLLVNIGSGVSIIKVDDFGKFERVSGTSLGGGTLWGLLSLLTDADSFDEMLELSEKGDNGTVDLLVSDVYGNSNALNAFGLKSSTIASSFGKVFRKENNSINGGAEGRKKKFKPEDICKSLLYAVSNNIGQIAHMTAEKYDLDRIYFGGCFIRGHQATISTLSYAIRFWSKGTKRAFFLRHEGYLGAIGAWIKHLDDPPAVRSGRSPMETEDLSSSPSPMSRSSLPNAAPSDLISSPTTRSTSSPSSSGFLPAKTMESSGLLPTPIAEAAEPNPLAHAVSGSPARHVTPSTTETVPASLPPALAEALGSTTRTAPAVADQVEESGPRVTRSEQVQANGTDSNPDNLLAMLQTLQNDHRSLVEPLVQANNHLVGSGPQGGQVNGSSATAQSVEGEIDDDDDDDAALMELMSGNSEGDLQSIQELLQKLDQADSAADGLEGKLDVLLSRLDSMLASGTEVVGEELS